VTVAAFYPNLPRNHDRCTSSIYNVPLNYTRSIPTTLPWRKVGLLKNAHENARLP